MKLYLLGLLYSFNPVNRENKSMGNLITSKQWTHGCYVKTPDKYVMVVKEKAITIDEETRQVVSVKNRLTFDEPSLINPKRIVYVTKPEFRNHKYNLFYF